MSVELDFGYDASERLLVGMRQGVPGSTLVPSVGFGVPPKRTFLVRRCGAARLTVLASLPKGLGPTERKIAMRRRYYASDISEEALVKIEAAIRRADLTNPAAAARDFRGSL